MAFKSLGTVAGQATTTPSAQAQLPIDTSSQTAIDKQRTKLRIAVVGSGGLRIEFAPTADSSQAAVTSKLFCAGVEYIERGVLQYYSVMSTSGTVDYSISTGELTD